MVKISHTYLYMRLHSNFHIKEPSPDIGTPLYNVKIVALSCVPHLWDVCLFVAEATLQHCCLSCAELNCKSNPEHLLGHSGVS